MYDQKQQRLFTSNMCELDEKIIRFAQLPYKQAPFRGKNWGHPLHSLCSYPSKMKPSIAYTLITNFTKLNDVICDPFAGSGTIPLEACLNGRCGIGCDISPLAHVVTNAKIRPPKLTDILKRIEQLEQYIVKSKLTEKEIEQQAEYEILDFYHPDTMKEIIIAKQFLISHNEDYDWKFTDVDGFLIASLAHILHGNRPYALSRRSHNIIPIPPKGEFVYKSVIKSLREKVVRILKNSIPSGFITGKSHNCSVLDIPLPNSSVDAIITSPPFLWSTQFLRQNRIRIWLCGWDYKKQKSMREQFLEEKKHAMIYDQIFKRFSNMLKKNGLCIMHLGVVGKRNMGKEILPYANRHGFSVADIVYEDTSDLENHGRTDRGSTRKHQFLFLTH